LIAFVYRDKHKLVEGESELFDRYDEGQEAKLAKIVGVSRPVVRRPVFIAAFSFFAVLACSSVIATGFTRIFCATLAAVVAWNCFTRHKLEHFIVQSHGESLGIVTKHRRLGIKRGAIIDYTFLSADGRTHFGTLHGSTGLPQEGQTFMVIYNLADPSLNLPLFSFWFYEFDFEFPETIASSSS
jgi:hypothetical protein